MTDLRGWAVFLVAATLASGTWADIDRLGPTVVAAFALLVLFLAWAPWAWLGVPRIDSGARGAAWRPSTAWLVPAALAAPAAFFLVATWSQEFPFSGDHDFHLEATAASLRFWRPWIWIVPLAAATAWLAFRRRVLGTWAVAWLAVFGAASFFAEVPWHLARVPGGAAFLGLPAGTAFALADAPWPLDAARLTTFASLPLWLLVLRPALIGRPPDRGAAVFGAYFWLQKDVVYYLTTSYAEPWMIVVVLLAAEYLLSVEGPRELNACLLVGAAAMIKEPAILTLPFFWLACRPWRGSWRERARASLAGVVAAAPFLLYYAVRREAEIWRGASLASSAELFSLERVAELGRRAWIQLGWPGIVATAAVVVLLAALARALPRLRLKLAMLAGAAAGQVAFFYADSFSTFWTGYPRFHLLAFALLGAGLLVLPAATRALARPAVLATAAAILAVLQVSVTLPFLRLALLPEPARNFVEHYEAPCFFPIASLIGEADRTRALDGVRRVAVSDPLGTESFPTLEAAYPELERRLDLTIVPDSFGAPLCRCRDAAEAVLVPFVHFANLTPRDPAGPGGPAARTRCAEELRATCSLVLERSLGGEPTGLLGVGPG